MGVEIGWIALTSNIFWKTNPELIHSYSSCINVILFVTILYSSIWKSVGKIGVSIRKSGLHFVHIYINVLLQMGIDVTIWWCVYSCLIFIKETNGGGREEKTQRGKLFRCCDIFDVVHIILNVPYFRFCLCAHTSYLLCWLSSVIPFCTI